MPQWKWSMVAILSALCLSLQLYLVFIHSPNADMSEQSFIKKKVEKLPSICSLSWTAFSAEVPQLGYQHQSSSPDQKEPICLLRAMREERPQYCCYTWHCFQPGQNLIVHLSSQHSRGQHLIKAPQTASHTHELPCRTYAWPLNPVQLHHPATTVAPVLMDVFLLCSLIWCRHTDSLHHLGNWGMLTTLQDFQRCRETYRLLCSI